MLNAARFLHPDVIDQELMNLWNLRLYQRRWLTVLGALLLTSLACVPLLQSFVLGNPDTLDCLAALAFVLIMLAGTFNLWLYVFGFFLSKAIDDPTRVLNGPITTRTALVMPIFNEDAEQVAAGVREIWSSLRAAELAPFCDFYLLSDTVDQSGRKREDAAYAALLPLFNDNRDESGRIHLVRRKEHGKFKAGNIASFLRNYATSYDFMVVLDADSVMLGPAIKRLIYRMQSDPAVALVQSLIVPIRAHSLFGLVMQFGASRGLPVFGCGLHWFWGPDSVYWGHNAIVRIEPFMEFCNLPTLPGRPPLGGDIMSQDIVEAALLGRAGWKVEWDLVPSGSFDQMPPDVLAYGQRDRRWCQGNFQHFWLIFGDGMKLAHRLYFAIGIMAYATSPLLLILLVIGFTQGLRGRDYETRFGDVATFVCWMLSMMFIPKALAFLRRIRLDAPLWKEGASFLIESFVGVILAPSILYMHTVSVLSILCGRPVRWISQQRMLNAGLSWISAAKVFGLPTLVGVLWLALALKATPGFVIFLAPVLIGWILSIPVATMTSDPRFGSWAAKYGLLSDSLSEEERYALQKGHVPQKSRFRQTHPNRIGPALVIQRRDQGAS